jgi:hypothetical protein
MIDTATPPTPDTPTSDTVDNPEAGDLSELDALRRTAERSARDADADRRLADLKRRMGK